MNTTIYDCFTSHHELSQCWWRAAFSQTPLCIFWLATPLVYLRWKTYKKPFYIHPLKGILRVGLLFLLFCESILNFILDFDGPYSERILAIIMVLSYASLTIVCELYRRKNLLIHSSIYISLLLLTLFKLTYLIVKVVEESGNSELLAEVILLMIETTLLSISDYDPDRKNGSPEENSSWLSKLIFSWMTPLVRLGSRRTLQFSDLYPLRKDCLSATLLPKWELEWKKSQLEQARKNKLTGRKEPASVVLPFIRTQFPLIVEITICRLFADMIHYTSPFLLKQLIDIVSTPSAPLSAGIGVACLMFICAETRSFLQNHQVYGMFRLTVYFQAILNSTILRKTLRLSPTARSGRTSGEIQNLVAVDVEKLIGSIPYMQNTWSIPFQVTLAMTMLWYTIGPAALAGIAVMITFIPINYYSSFYIKKAQLKQMRIKDERTKMSAELLNGLKVVKLYAWETTFENRINELRRREVEQLKWVSIASRIVDAANAAAPFLVALASFTTFSIMYDSNALTPAIAFVSLAIFNQIRQPMRMLAMLINNLAQSFVSNKRVKNYLSEDEIDVDIIGRCKTDEKAIVLESACLNWRGSCHPPSLGEINLSIPGGSLSAIVGPVGSGKSSLLSALLGEMHLCSGNIYMTGSTAYVPQQPWIYNKSIRENILFGAVYEPNRYRKVVHACELERDFEMFDDGDFTEMGENGVNLSGGQKARIGLARAVYQNCDVYLLDDPLSALDSHVGRAVFDRVFGKSGLLAGKTRLLVTHGLHFTKDVDQIIVMDEGKIVQEGTYPDLAASDGLFSTLLSLNPEKEKPEEMKEPVKRMISKQESVVAKSACDEGKAAELIKKEHMELGRVRTGVYWMYMKSMALRNSSCFFLFFILHYAFQILRSLWLSDWSNQNIHAAQPNNSVDVDTRLWVYGGIGLLEVLMIGLAFVFLTLGSLRASLGLHNPLVHALVRAPITFFDVTPIGRIINRLAKDMETVDTLPMNLRQLTQSILHVGMIFFLVSFSMPIFIIVAIPLLGVYILLMRFFVPTVRQLKRMESVNRSPILSTFGETIQGVSSIRAFQKSEDVCSQLETLVDQFTRCKYLTISVNRWLSTRLELLGNSVVISSAIIGTISAKYFDLSPGLIGLSVSYALSITEVLNVAVRMLGEMETNVVAVERVKEYHRIESEAAWESDHELNEQWPAKGEIRIRNYKMRYRNDLPLVLNGVDVFIQPGEKIAVVGRTGSGKSSLTMGLFRMIEAAGGSIEIDGISTAQIGLHELRRKMAIIPQDPVLFSGTLRFNLDPFDSYTDEEVWTTLDKCQLSRFASGKADGLQFAIAEGGKNMSLGERQLVCLGRAILRGGRILVLDEATAAVDSATDSLVQSVVRSEFPEATIITIAHRLDTIEDYDKIIVMEDGKIAEFDSPQHLLDNPESMYSRMVEKSKKMR